MTETTETKSNADVGGQVEPVVIFRSGKGQVEIGIGNISIFLFWPRFVKNNVDVGFMVKTGFMFKGYNEWSHIKAKSIALLVLGFGIGVQRTHKEI